MVLELLLKLVVFPFTGLDRFPQNGVLKGSGRILARQ
jgi:hypothetical protein